LELINYFHINIQHRKYFLHTSYSTYVYVDSPYSIIDIPFMGKPFVLSVVDYLKTMSLATHVNSEFKDLNYDKFHIRNVYYILTTFNGDVLFKLPSIDNLNNHFGHMQGMDMKHDDHAWCKVKMTTSRTILALLFEELHAWAICNVKMMSTISFFLTNVETK